MVHAEPLSLWENEIRALQIAVRLWGAVESRDEKTIAEFKEILSNPDAPLAVRKQMHLDKTDPTMTLLGQIQRFTDHRLQQHVYARFLFPGNQAKLNLVLQPQSLLGALWLQFANAVDGRKKFQWCDTCRLPFEVSREILGRRRSARFCSTRCRVAQYRSRIERAKALNAEGRPLKEIAGELRTSLRTLRGWLD